ncbi:daunorubicin resistance protein DrrA family ABC transporter ATP-binding protein [Actinorhabdospora filicis]|uniref:Daunorubicin resistance protein DrrA family ABC transporter ATP-binding protein n=1 Tax=Actinorhabdospora filicis TaxID=1785913 RepID=A0A9W6W8T9_9ACTN|nr:ATP-binding cassette domain-containing protein [Actinorhabdospora filicis]GLZ77899.1 daunorubicin resistance protein DrrA family ABC transporter ATP-binding protein [Actinorhabdospora filicis]
MSSTTTHIEAHGLVKTYPPDTRALDGLSIAIAPGEVFGLLGPNGAGKSTAINILTTLARPDSGTATIAGHDVLRRPQRVRRAIGVVAQNSGADPLATGRDNLMLQGRLYGLGGTPLKQRVAELFERFGLTGAADRAVRTYSGGMRRRLDVALGLVHRPSALFLDEPTTGLDPEARAALWAEIARLSAEDGLTILLTTHYLEEADRLTDRLAIVDKGRVVVTGTADALKGELKGDAVRIELRDEPAAGLGDLAAEGLREVSLAGRLLSARADDGAAAVPGVLAALDRAGAPAASVTVARPSLDDVYLRHVGHRFDETNGSLS